MLNYVINTNLNDYVMLTFSVTLIGITYCMINNYRNNVLMVRQVDTTRVNEGLPTDLTLTPEDFTNNPELVEIFEGVNPNQNLDIILESNEHFNEHLVQIENQFSIINYDNLITLCDLIVDFCSYLF